MWVYARCVFRVLIACAVPGRRKLNKHMRQLECKLQNVLKKCRAPKTVVKYEAGFKRWKRWAKEQNVKSLPADPYHVVLYLIDLMQTASSPAPISTAVYSIAWKHKNSGLPDPTSNELVSRVHQAARRSMSKPVCRKKPITAEVVQRLGRKLLRSPKLADLQTAVLITLGYAGLMRWDDLSKIVAEEIIIRQKYMAVFLESRKNDQMRHGNWIIVSRWKGAVCPVKLVEAFLLRGRHREGSPLFGRVRRDRKGEYVVKAMSYTRARELVLGALEDIGEQPSQYGLHSLRSGGASAAIAAGIPDRLVKRQGGWRSDNAMGAYFQESLPAMTAVSKALEL